MQLLENYKLQHEAWPSLKWFSDSECLYCITPSALCLALAVHCWRKEEAKLSCDPWRRIQQEQCWLVMGKSTGIRCIRWQLEASIRELGCWEGITTPSFLTPAPILSEASSIHYVAVSLALPIKIGMERFALIEFIHTQEATVFHISKSTELRDNQMVYAQECHSQP